MKLGGSLVVCVVFLALALASVAEARISSHIDSALVAGKRQDGLWGSERAHVDRKLFSSNIEKYYGQSTDAVPIEEEEVSNRRMLEVIAVLESAPESNPEKISKEALDMLGEGSRRRRALK